MEAPQQSGRPRSKSNFSFHSDKSRDNPSRHSKQDSRPKNERRESALEKRKTHYDPTTKANPNAAMEEAQPIAAALEKPTLQSLRSFQHNDSAGNPIADPDLSNPTRSRWERPLDTIRSFEAAIDGEYKRRAASMRVEQNDMMSGYGSRRSSYYGGGGGYEQNRYSTASYYNGGNRGYGRESSYESGYGMGGPVGGPSQRMRYGNRMQSDPGYRPNHNVYPVNGYQQSRDTVNTHGTSGSNGSHSEPYSTDPSSENSSIERAVPVKPPQPDLGEQYGFSGFGGRPNMHNNQGPMGNGGEYFSHPHARNHQAAPPPPPKHATPVAPMKLGNSTAGPPSSARPGLLQKNSSDEKRKSWFKRKWSK